VPNSSMWCGQCPECESATKEVFGVLASEQIGLQMKEVLFAIHF
jgi:hypothetical protein